jgi:dimethylhistidine N-methyltransferase
MSGYSVSDARAKQSQGNNRVEFYDFHPALADIKQEVLAGLGSGQKNISPKFFYDEIGSKLFDAICDAPEYYPTRTEQNIITDNMDEIVDCIGQNCILVEPGSGSSQKVCSLLDNLEPTAYMPMDISRQHLINAANRIANEYDWLDVHAACVDYTAPFDMPHDIPNARKVVFFPGSSIGNFEPADAVTFLKLVAKMVGKDGGLLIGVDLKKHHEILNPAYNDAAGVTAAFNLNLLTRINRELGADFDLLGFSHTAFYNEQLGRIEMHLISEREQQVKLEDTTFNFAEGETIHTESSYKYSIDEFVSLAKKAGFESKQVWTDDKKLFSVHYFNLK